MSQYHEEQIVDVEKRTKEVGQVLGDPTLFPVEFLSWLKRYIEQSGIQLPVSSIIGGFQPGGGSVRNLTAGIILAFGGPIAPPGSLPCVGGAHSRSEYALLFDRIGTSWGTPPDSSSFLAPDFRRRGPFGLDGSDPSFNAVGKYGGEKDHTLTIGEMPSHTHPIKGPSGGTPTTYLGFQQFAQQTNTYGVPTDAAGGGGAHNNMPPFGVVLYVITTGQ